ncbi:MAG TPA: ABC transporter substrate-binding protein [Thermomicrobiaceae bacterium]|nr:ABC transporter substrate-binding protein [Thermomicrobiaceae bacterium]
MDSLKWWEDAEQIKLLKARLDAINVSRRDFLRVVGAAGGTAAVSLAIAACGGSSTTPTTSTTSTTATTTTGGSTGSTATAAASSASTPTGGAAATSTTTTANLAANQTFTDGTFTTDPTSFDFNKDLYCGGNAACFAQLTQFDPDLSVIPDIASKWEPNADGSVWTFHLRTDSKWSNGQPVTANDYEYSYKRQLDPATAASYAGFLYDLKNAQAFNLKQGNVTAADVGVKATDAQTLVCTLEGPRAYWPVLAAYTAAAPSYQPAVEKYGDKWTEAANIVCNGPYTLTAWAHNTSFTLTRNEGYWNAKNLTLKTIQCPIIAQSAFFTSYQNNQIDWDSIGSLGDLKKVQSDATLSKEFIKYSQTGTWWLQPNVKMAPFDNKNVRLAMAHAIDRKTIVDQVLQGLGTVAYNIIPPGTPGFDPNTWDTYTSYDPQKAMSLLEGTPYAGGKNWPSITMTQRNNEGDAPQIAGDAIVAMLKQNLGMDIKHVLGDPKTVYNEAYQGRLQLIWWRWFIDYPDPNDDQYLVFYSKFPSGERNTFSDPTYDSLVTKAAGIQDQTTRFQTYWQADQILVENGADIFVYNPWTYGLLKPWVAGMPKNKSGAYVPNWNVFVRMYDYLKIQNH